MDSQRCGLKSALLQLFHNLDSAEPTLREQNLSLTELASAHIQDALPGRLKVILVALLLRCITMANHVEAVRTFQRSLLS